VALTGVEPLPTAGLDSGVSGRYLKTAGLAPRKVITMKVLDRVCLDKVDVRRMTEDALARLGIRLINREEVILQCLNCEETWEPVLDCSGKLRPGYWHCPAGYNRGAEQAG
jgi:hypothetical protein